MSFYLNLFKIEPSYFFSLLKSDLPGLQIDQPLIESARVWFDFRQDFKKKVTSNYICVQRRSDVHVGAHKGQRRYQFSKSWSYRRVHRSTCPSQLGPFFSPKPLLAQLRFFLCKVITRTPSSPSGCGLSNEEENEKGREKAWWGR